MTEHKLQNKLGQLCGTLYRAQNRDLFYVILDTNNKQLNYVKIHNFYQNATKEKWSQVLTLNWTRLGH